MKNQCEEFEIPCHHNEDSKFDDICQQELAFPINVDEIINYRGYCNYVPLDQIQEDGPFSLEACLDNLKGMMGDYHLWIDAHYCYDHEIYPMLCVYIGKGYAWGRIKSHIKEKWPETKGLYVSFYACENRIAKYIEQLFLDVYNFYLNLNESENSGVNPLYGRWDEHRHDMGTETLHISPKVWSRGHLALPSLRPNPSLI